MAHVEGRGCSNEHLCAVLDDLHHNMAALPNNVACHRYQHELCTPDLRLRGYGLPCVLVRLGQETLAWPEPVGHWHDRGS